MMGKVLEKLLLLAMVVVSSYQVVHGLERFSSWAVFYLTVSFGVLVVAGLLLLVFSVEILENPFVVVAAALVPLGLSLALIYTHLPRFHIPYLVFSLSGIILISFTRKSRKPVKTLSLAVVHGIAGMVIFLLPILLYLRGRSGARILWVSLGAGIIGLGGMLLALLQLEKPLIPRRIVLALLPWILFAMSLALSLGLDAL